MTEETRLLTELRPHPENTHIFGDPEESEQFEEILASIRKNGIWEPLVIKADGKILSGHLRLRCAEKLKLKTVPVRVREPFASYRDEVAFVIRSNTDRRQLTKGEMGLAFKRLRNLPKEEGGAKKKMGRRSAKEHRELSDGNCAASGTHNSFFAREEDANHSNRARKSRDDAASMLGIGRHEAEALETVFATPGVPEELKSAVNRGTVAPTPAAKAVRDVAKAQGVNLAKGEAIKDPAPLLQAAAPKAQVRRIRSDHEERVSTEAAKYRADYSKLFELYKTVDALLTRRPLKTVLGPTEHHEYADVIRDLAIRAWREIESVTGPSTAGKQMTLTVVRGGGDGRS